MASRVLFSMETRPLEPTSVVSWSKIVLSSVSNVSVWLSPACQTNKTASEGFALNFIFTETVENVNVTIPHTQL